MKKNCLHLIFSVHEKKAFESKPENNFGSCGYKTQLLYICVKWSKPLTSYRKSWLLVSKSFSTWYAGPYFPLSNFNIIFFLLITFTVEWVEAFM